MRVPSGVEGFDGMVQGGLPEGSVVIVQGPSGTEKVSFGLQFLARGLKNGEAVVVILSTMSPASFLEELGKLGVDLSKVQAEGRLRIVDWYSQREEAVSDVEERGLIVRASIDLANVSIALSKAIAGLPDKTPKRGLLEVLSPALSVYDLEHVYAFAQGSLAKLRRFKITSVCLIEKEMHDPATLSTLHQPFDGVVDLERTRVGDEIVRKIAVLSMKDTQADSRYETFRLVPGRGVVVGGTTEPSKPRPVRRVAPAEEAKPPARPRVVAKPSKEAAKVDPRRVAVFLRIAEERIKVNPKDADAWFARAAALASLNKAGDAMKSLDSLAVVDARYPGLWVLKAKLHARLGQIEQARAARLKAVEAGRPEEPARAEGVAFPCPLCEFKVQEGASECPNCGARFVEEEELAEELEVLGHEAIQERVKEELRGKPEEAAGRVPPKRPEPTRPQPPKPGLTNGLVREGLRPTAGRTNGLTNGLRGRTNGLTNGVRGRTNGLTNGLRGRTNGLTNGLRGRTNGLVNGLASLRQGLTNGLTNGTGFTNGLGSPRFSREARIRRWKLYVIPVVAAALLIVPLIAPPSILESQIYPITIDGVFTDWPSTSLVDVASKLPINPNIDIIRVAVFDNVDFLSFLVEVRGTVLSGGPPPNRTMDSFFVFVDADRSFATGYRVNGIGADRLIEIDGWGGNPNVTALMDFDVNRNSNDWNGWIKAATVATAASGSRMETQVDWLALAPSKLPMDVFVAARGWDGDFDGADVNVGTVGGELVVTQQSLAPVTLSGMNQPILGVDLAASRLPATYSGLSIRLLGTHDPSKVSLVKLTDGSGTVLDQRIPFTSDISFTFPPRSLSAGTSESLFVVADVSGTDGRTFGAVLESADRIAVANTTVTLRTSMPARDLGYLGAIPTDPRVDGGFSEWGNARSDSRAEPSVGRNPQLDLLRYSFKLNGSDAYAYLRVDGPAFNGSVAPRANGRAPGAAGPSQPDADRDSVPDAIDPFPNDFNNDGIPDAQTNGDYDGDGVTDYGFPGGTDVWLNTTIPATFPSPYGNRTVRVYIGPVTAPPLLGEDWARVFIDVDNTTATGYAVGGLGADYLVELRGRHGAILRSDLLSFIGAYPGAWSWTEVSQAATAKGYAEVELVAAGLVGVDPGARVYLETGDWDLNGDVSDTPTGTRGSFSAQPMATTLLTAASGVGSADGDKYGFNVSYAGRINENAGGTDDLIIGAPYVDFGGANDRGAIYLFFGTSGLSGLDAANADVVIYGEAADDHFGWSVSDAGDVDGDGYGDVLVGAPDAGAGKVYLIYGRTTVSWSTASGNSVASVSGVVTITGQSSGDFFGGSVTNLGNLDGSGNDDFAVGAYKFNSNKGRVYIFLGDGSIPTKASQADVKLDGAAGGDKFGLSVRNAGDVNGDSTPDLIIGAPGVDKAYVVTVAQMPIANPYFTTDATSWTYTEVDGRTYGSGAWEDLGSADAESSGAGHYKFTYADGTSTQVVYFHSQSITSNTKSNRLLAPEAPDTAGQSIYNKTTSIARIIVDIWATEPLGVTSIKTGTWTFYYWVAADSGNTVRMEAHVFKRSSAGSETIIDGSGSESDQGVAQTVEITSTTKSQYSGTWTIGSDISLATTDSVVVKLYMNRTAGTGNKGGTFYFDSTSDNSRIAASTLSTAARRYFHSETVTVNTATTEKLVEDVPDQGSTQTRTVTTASTGHYLLDEWTTEQLGITSLSGYFYFRYWGYAEAAMTAHFDVHIYKRTASGTLTVLDGTDGLDATDGVAASSNLGTASAVFHAEFNMGSQTLGETDALVVRIYLDVTAVTASSTGTFEFDTTGTNSRVVLPVRIPDRMILTQSASFTTPSTAATETKWTLGWSSSVSSIGDASYAVELQVRTGGDTDTVTTVYDSGTKTAAQAFAVQTGTTSALSTSTAYRLRVVVAVTNDNIKDTPTVTVYVDDVTLTFRTHAELSGTASTNFGWSVSTAGNVDDDGSGYADVVVGAPDTTNGNAYIYYGGSTFDTTVDVTITGAASGDKFGYSVSNAGDISGDGISDVAIGAPYWDNGATTDVGKVYVFAGSASLASTLAASDATYDYAGETAGDHLGWSVSDAGDVDANGIKDLIVGAPDFDAAGTDRGKVYVLYIPEFEQLVVPVAVVLVAFAWSRRGRRRVRGSVPRQ